MWAVQDDRLLVTWLEADTSVEGAATARLPASALSVLTSRFLDPVVVVHKNGSVGLYAAGKQAAAPQCLARTPARPDGRRLRWARLVALKGSETGTYLLIGVAQHAARLATGHSARLVVYRIVSRRAAAARAAAASSKDDAESGGTVDVSVELSADHELPAPPSSGPSGDAVATACLHKALLRLTVVWESGAVQSLAFPVRPLWYLARPAVAWTRLLASPAKAIERAAAAAAGLPLPSVASADEASDAEAWDGSARAFAVEPGCLVLVATPRGAQPAQGKARGVLVSVWDARHGIAVAQRTSTVAGDDADASAAMPAPPEEPSAAAAQPRRVRRRRSSSVVDPTVLAAPSSAAAPASEATDPLVAATVAADGGMLCIAATHCATLARLALRAPSLASAFGQAASTARLLRGQPSAAAPAAGSAPPSLPSVIDGSALFAPAGGASSSSAASSSSSSVASSAATAALSVSAVTVALQPWSDLAEGVRPAGDPAAERAALAAVSGAATAAEARAALTSLDALSSPPGCPELVAAEVVAAAARRCVDLGLTRPDEAPRPATAAAAGAKRRSKRRRASSAVDDDAATDPAAAWRALLVDALESGRVDSDACPDLLPAALSRGKWAVVDAALRRLRGVSERSLASALRSAVRAAARQDPKLLAWVRAAWAAEGVDLTTLDEAARGRRAAAAPSADAMAATRGLEHVVSLCAARERNDVFLQRSLRPSGSSGGLGGEEAAATLACLTRLLRRFVACYPDRWRGADGTLPPSVVAVLTEEAQPEDAAAVADRAGARASAASGGAAPADAAAEAEAAVLLASGGRASGERRARRRQLDSHAERLLVATLKQKHAATPAGDAVPGAEWGSPLPGTPLPPLGRLLDWSRILVDAAFPALLVGAAGTHDDDTTAKGGAMGVLRRLQGVVADLSSGARALSGIRGHLAHTLQRLPHPEAPLPGYFEQPLAFPSLDP